MFSLSSHISTCSFGLRSFRFLPFFTINIVGIMASNAGGARPKRSTKHCSGCHKPVRGHVGPHGPLCRQPSPQFVTDIPDLANLQQDIEASIQVHRNQINNLTAELELLNIGSSTPLIVSSASRSSITSPVAALHPPLVMPYNQAPTVTWSRPAPVAHVGSASVPVSVPVSSLASFSPSTTSAANSQNKNSDEQLVSLFRSFLQQMKASSTVDSGCIPAVISSVASPAVTTMLGLRQNPYIASQADTLLSTLPLFAPALGLTSKGKSAGDLAFSPPVKHPQLWPHQFVIKLDSTSIAYKDLSLPQFVLGYIDCLRNSSVSQQPAMLSHLYPLMDLASRFQWPAVRAFHSWVLKALEQGSTTWDSDFSRFQTGIFLQSQELSQPSTSQASKVLPPRRRPDKDSVCKEWNFSNCNTPCVNDKFHVCFICKANDHRAPSCPKHRCSPSCTWTHPTSG